MKMTLLEMVQDILSDMSGDYANSIGDTEESLQVAQIIKSTYHEMMARREWPHLKKVITLQSYSDNRYPIFLLIPEATRRVEWITYSQKTKENPDASFSEIKYMEPGKFVQWTNSRNINNESIVTVTTPDNVILRINNNTPPTYWTSFDDKTVVMDSWDSGVEDTLQGINSQSEVIVHPKWEDSNNFVPSIPAHLFPALLSESKSTCFLVIKKMPNEKAEQQSVRQQKVLSTNGWRLAGGISYPNYGRKRWIR